MGPSCSPSTSTPTTSASSLRRLVAVTVRWTCPAGVSSVRALTWIAAYVPSTTRCTTPSMPKSRSGRNTCSPPIDCRTSSAHTLNSATCPAASVWPRCHRTSVSTRRALSAFVGLRNRGLAPAQLGSHDGLSEKPAGQPAARLAQPLRQLGQLFDDAGLDAEPVKLLDDRRLLFHPRSSWV